MKSILFALLALFLFAVQNVILEQKLAKYTAETLLVYFYLIMLPLAFLLLAYARITNQTIEPPFGNAVLIVLGTGLILFLANFFYINAYTSGGNLLTITTIVILFPVFASVIKFAWVGGLPNLYQIGGYILAVAAVFLTIKGNL